MTISFKTATIAFAALAALLAVGAGAVYVLVVVFEYPGGMRPSYAASDRDARLMPIARSAAPIIAAINGFYGAHDRCPHANDADVAELRPALPQNTAVTLLAGGVDFRQQGALGSWRYSSADTKPPLCTLAYKLGWDPSLVWSRRGAETKWLFVPGDGGAERAIDLDIGQ